jgi:hypothetical protein
MAQKSGRDAIEPKGKYAEENKLQERIEFLEQKLFDLTEENKDLRQLIRRL